jgi:hypothetical protein
MNIGRRELLGQFVVLRFDVFELFKQRSHGKTLADTGNQQTSNGNFKDWTKEPKGLNPDWAGRNR